MKDNLSPKNLKRRALSKKPSFWQKVQNIALVVAGISATILTSGAAFPAVITTIAGYAAAASGAVATVSQFASKDKIEESPADSVGSVQK